VWFARTGGLGTSVYPINGFIYGGGGAESGNADLPRLPSLELDLSDLVLETNIG
jgi:hypothetical protein